MQLYLQDCYLSLFRNELLKCIYLRYTWINNRKKRSPDLVANVNAHFNIFIMGRFTFVNSRNIGSHSIAVTTLY